MIRTDAVHHPVYAITHPGMTGKNNEDRYGLTGLRLGPADNTPAVLAVLADGIGGHRAGEVAAQMAVDIVLERVSTGDPGAPLEAIRAGIVEASEAIHVSAADDPSRQGMGATCAVVLLMGRRMYTATVGDSRIYLMRGDTIRQISIDHTWIQEALDSGVLHEEDVRGHPNAHVIRRYLGSPQPPEVDQRIRLNPRETDAQSVANQGITLKNGDRVLLCSDGLSDLVGPLEILEAFQTHTAEAALQSLVDLANVRGGHDNITIVTIQIPGGKGTPPAKRSKIPRWLLGGCLLILASVVLIAALAFGWLWLNDLPPFNGDATGSPPAVVTVGPGTPLPDELDGAAPATATLRPLPSQTLTPVFLPPDVLENGATLTPWSTNTPAPTTTATATITSTPTPQ